MPNAIICPTVTAFDLDSYKVQMDVIKPFASYVHIDVMDGELAPTKSPPLNELWWHDSLSADIHLMFKRPEEVIDDLIKLKPSLVIVHFEAEGDLTNIATLLRGAGIKVGLAVLQETPIDSALSSLEYFDQLLIFSGHLGFHGGVADLGLLFKARIARQHFPDIQISWDGGINDLNAKSLINDGINVLNVGGYIQNSDDPINA